MAMAGLWPFEGIFSSAVPEAEQITVVNVGNTADTYTAADTYTPNDVGQSPVKERVK
jgi:hypothetical protein